MALASNANTLHERCIDYLLHGNEATTFNAAQLNELDANQDGVVNMDDLSTIINMELNNIRMAKAATQQDIRAKMKADSRKLSKIMPISREIKQLDNRGMEKKPQR